MSLPLATVGLMSNLATLLLIGILMSGLDFFMSTFSLSMLLLLLAGDVETNPGPGKCSYCRQLCIQLNSLD